MRKLNWLVLACAALSVVGCSGGGDAEESKDLRKSMTTNEKFDINKVPPEHRAMVEAMTRGGGGRPGSKPAAPPAKPAGGG